MGLLLVSCLEVQVHVVTVGGQIRYRTALKVQFFCNLEGAVDVEEKVARIPPTIRFAVLMRDLSSLSFYEKEGSPNGQPILSTNSIFCIKKGFSSQCFKDVQKS